MTFNKIYVPGQHITEDVRFELAHALLVRNRNGKQFQSRTNGKLQQENPINYGDRKIDVISKRE